MLHMLSVSFYIKRQRLNDKKEAPIIIRLKLQGTIRDISSGLRVVPAQWNSRFGAVKGSNDLAKQINGQLSADKNKLLKIFTQLSYAGEVLIDDVVEAFQGKTAKKEQSLLDLVRDHNQHVKHLIGIDYTESTYEKYWVMQLRVTQYVKEYLKKKDIPVRKLDRKFISEFFLYLKEVHHNQHNSATKTVKNLKRVLSYAVEQGHIEHNPFVGFKCGYKETPRTVLTDDELRRIEAKKFSIPRLELVKNLFLFQCYTGLSYVDMSKLTWRNVVAAEEELFWLEITRTKTGQSTQIPLFPVALQIIRKYDQDDVHNPENKLLPTYEIQKTNSYLKEIADLCGINKNLSTHAGRRTFASTVMLNNGVRIEAVSRMLAHSSIRITQQYAKVYDQHLLDETKHVKWLWRDQ
jgi:site-specific recombinase XerD